MARLTSNLLLAIANLVGALAFAWPFVFSSVDGARLVPYAWAVVLPVTLVIVAQSLLAHDRDIRRVTLMATLVALAAAVRPLGAGVAGLEPIWAVILLSGRALGARAGFVIGALAIAISALITGGVGPWMPYQMMVAAWAGALPGLLPRLRGRPEVLWMAGLGLVTGIVSGALLNLWFWPLAIGLTPEIAFTPGASALSNGLHWLHYGLLTSMGFDVPRALVTATLLALTTPRLLPILRRASRRATFTAVMQGADPAQ
ncbi:MAG: ECF transporter S component [Candidatus Nanopelagicales bacterium]